MKTRQKLTITIATLFCLGVNSALAQDFEWAWSFGDNGFDISYGNTVDAAGNIYTTGYFEGTIDFDPGAGTANLVSDGGDVFIQKLDAAGNFVWAKSFGGGSSDEGYGIAVDAAGNVYTTGTFRTTVDFDPGAGVSNLTSNGGYEIFVQKLDASGNFLWANSYGSNFDDMGKSIKVDASGNVYVTGFFSGTVDFDPGAGISNFTSNGANDVFVQKLTTSGDLIWAKSFGGNSGEDGRSIAIDASGNVYTTGFFSVSVDFDPGVGTVELTSTGNTDIFIQKLDPSGNFLWAQSFGDVNGDDGLSIAVDASGNVYATGRYQGTPDFDPGAGTANLISNGSYDIYIQKLDASGNFIWAKSFGGTSSDICYSIAVDALGNAYTTGSFGGTVDFDPNSGTSDLISNGVGDIFVQKLNATGNFVWARSFGGSDTDIGYSIAVDPAGNIITTGSYEENMDFDPSSGVTNYSSEGYYDLFIQKLSTCTTAPSTETHTACDSYTWIDGINYTASNNTATFILNNAAGCDSVVTLNLTINTVSDINTSTSGITITATNSNPTYQWLDCDNNYAEINGETNQTFTPSANGNYAVELTENGCVDTSDCVVIASVGVNKNDFGNNLNVYPNPTTGEFSIDLMDNLNSVIVTITDIEGRFIQQTEYKNSQVLNLNLNQPSGIYFINIQSDEQTTVIRLIKE